MAKRARYVIQPLHIPMFNNVKQRGASFSLQLYSEIS